MIRTLGIQSDHTIITNFSLHDIEALSLSWYWIDFENPTPEEASLLKSFFHFHPLAIEDALQYLQRPKIDVYEDFSFFVLHSIQNAKAKASELNLFVSERYFVTFHYDNIEEITVAREQFIAKANDWSQHSNFAVYQVLDAIVDHYFPIVFEIEERLNAIEDDLSPSNVHLSMDAVFEVRGDLLRLRRSIIPMRDVLFLISKSEKLSLSTNEHVYMKDIYANLLHLTALIEENRELTADIRDSQLSINSTRTNNIIMILTIVSTVFIPLTFIVGVYGMNFDRMPELQWRFGYLYVMLFMAIIAILMTIWFKYKGWFDYFKS